MVEIMVVISIILILAATFLYAAARYFGSASTKATGAVIRKVELALDEYRRLKGNYPPDGIDSQVLNDDRVPIRGSACLYFFFNKELTSQVESSGVQRIKKHEPLWLTKGFTDADRSPEDPEHPGVFEILDGFKVPLHYDNTEDGEFRHQDGSVHFPEMPVHSPDPRSSVALGAVKQEGIQKPGAYDLWSQGMSNHGEMKDLSKTIASWNLGLVSR